MANAAGGKNTIKALMKNPAARRIVARGMKKAATGAYSAFQSAQSRSQGAGQGQNASYQPKVTPLGTRAPSSAVESVAKPWAEKLAASSAGRSVLEAIHSVTSEALGTATPQRRTTAATAADTPQAAYRPEPSGGAGREPKFISYTPPADAPKAPPAPPSLKWRTGQHPLVEKAPD